MEYEDGHGVRYQIVESTKPSSSSESSSVWPWVIGGIVVAGGLVWMASSSTRKPNPVTPETETLIVEARDPNTEWTRLLDLSYHSEVEVRRAVLDNPNLCPTDDDGELNTSLLLKIAKEFPEEVAAHPVFVLHALIEPTFKMGEVVREVVEQTKDVGLIEQLLSTWGSGSSDVRFSVAKNPATPVDLLRLLGNAQTESDMGVRLSAARNPNMPEDMLRILGNEQTESVSTMRRTVASNPRTPEDLLRRMANPKTESSGWVRQWVAQNPNTPVDVLRTLANPATESFERVREAAQNALAERGLA